MIKYLFLLLFLFCFSAFSDTEFHEDCETKKRLYLLSENSLRNSSEWTISTHRLLFYLTDYSFNLVLDCARILNPDKQPDSEKQMVCLNDLLMNQSYDLDSRQDRIILSYMRDNFQSLGGILVAYNNEKERCEKYYAYGSLGFCIPFTGEKCLDREATIGVYKQFVTVNVKNAMGGRTGLNLPGTCVIRQFLTPQGELMEEVLRNESLNCY